MTTIPNSAANTSAHTWAKHHKPSSDTAPSCPSLGCAFHCTLTDAFLHLPPNGQHHWGEPSKRRNTRQGFLPQLTTLLYNSLDHNKYQYICWYSVIPWQPYSNSHTFHRQVSWYEQCPLRWHHPLKSSFLNIRVPLISLGWVPGRSYTVISSGCHYYALPWSSRSWSSCSWVL